LELCYTSSKITGYFLTIPKDFQDLLAKAEQGNVDAQYILGVCYQYGDGVGKDEKKAVEWYMKAAEQGDQAHNTG